MDILKLIIPASLASETIPEHLSGTRVTHLYLGSTSVLD